MVENMVLLRSREEAIEGGSTILPLLVEGRRAAGDEIEAITGVC